MPPARAVAEPVVLGWRCLLWLPVVQLVAVCSACVVGRSLGLRGPSCCGLIPECVDWGRWTGTGWVEYWCAVVCGEETSWMFSGLPAVAPCHQLTVSLVPVLPSTLRCRLSRPVVSVERGEVGRGSLHATRCCIVCTQSVCPLGCMPRTGHFCPPPSVSPEHSPGPPYGVWVLVVVCGCDQIGRASCRERV